MCVFHRIVRSGLGTACYQSREWFELILTVLIISDRVIRRVISLAIRSLYCSRHHDVINMTSFGRVLR